MKVDGIAENYYSWPLNNMRVKGANLHAVENPRVT